MWAAVQEAARDASRATCRFVRRHRRSILATSLAVGVGAAVYWRASAFLENVGHLREDLEAQLRSKRRRQRGVARARQESTRAVESFLPTLRARLAGLIDPNTAVRRLKELRNDPGYRQRRLEVWEELKASAFTRWVAMLYAATALNVLLRLQMHVLGRQALLEDERRERRGAGEAGGEVPGRDAASAMGPAERHRLLSLTYEYMLGDGLQRLVEACRAAVDAALRDRTVANQKKVPFEDFVSVVREMRDAVEAESHPASPAADPDSSEADAEALAMDAAAVAASTEGVPGAAEAPRPSPIISFLVHPQARTADAQSATVRKCLQETWDLAESPFFLFALRASLDRVFDLALGTLRKLYFEADAGLRSAHPGDELRAGDGLEPILLEPPLAHIITAIQKETTKILETSPDGRTTVDSAVYVDAIGQLEAVQALCNAAFGLEDEEDVL